MTPRHLFIDNAKETLDRLYNLAPNDLALLLSDVEELPHITTLAQKHQSMAILEAYINWLRSRFRAYKVDANHVISLWLKELLSEDEFIALNKDAYSQQKSYLDETLPLGKEAKSFLAILLSRKQEEAINLIMTLKETESIESIYMNIFHPVLYEIGRLWQIREASVAMEHFVTAVIQFLMGNFYQDLFKDSRPKKGTVLLSASGTELHEIGIRMIADLYELNGFHSVFLGGNLPASAIVEAIMETKPDFVALSATLSSHVHAVEDSIEKIRKNKQTKDIKIIVGGQPFAHDTKLYKKIGADAFASAIDEAIKIGADWCES